MSVFMGYSKSLEKSKIFDILKKRTMFGGPDFAKRRSHNGMTNNADRIGTSFG